MIFVPESLVEGIDAMAERIEVLEKLVSEQEKTISLLKSEKDLCMREVMRYRETLKALRATLNAEEKKDN